MKINIKINIKNISITVTIYDMTIIMIIICFVTHQLIIYIIIM